MSQREQSSSIIPYTYFTGPADITFCFEGQYVLPEKPDDIVASVAYCPDTDNPNE